MAAWNEYMTAPGSPPRGWPVDPNAVFRPIWCSPPNSQESKIWCIPIPRPQEILQQDLAARTRPGESQAAVDGVVYREDLDVNRPPSNSQRQVIVLFNRQLNEINLYFPGKESQSSFSIPVSPKAECIPPTTTFSQL